MRKHKPNVYFRHSDVARRIVLEINKFDRRCRARVGTDSGEAWELLNEIRRRLRPRQRARPSRLLR